MSIVSSSSESSAGGGSPLGFLSMSHPLWLVGFRPFFTIAFVAGALLPLIWVLVFTGVYRPSGAALPPLQWHAHEMLYGFGWAVLGGFLLTASKNWVKIRGLHGGPLAIAVVLWIVERVAVIAIPASTPDFWTAALRFVLLNGFLLFLCAYVVATLIRYRKSDSFRDNGFFIVALPLFLIAKNLLLNPEWYAAGVAMSIGLFRVAFAVMFERTITQSMKNALKIEVPRWRGLDFSIKVLILAAVFEAFLPAKLAATIVMIAGVLILVRAVTWSPIKALGNFGIGVMVIGTFGLGLHLLFEAARLSGIFAGVGSLSVHVFTLLCMGFVIPGMMIRISQGHTGRAIAFTTSDRVAYLFMAVAAFFRLIATQAWPESYSTWIALAGVGWSLCFVILAVRLTPYLWQRRIDGREH